MPRPKRYGSEAEKQAAYRLRKKEAVSDSATVETRAGQPVNAEVSDKIVKLTATEVSPENLPVPVLAEPEKRQPEKSLSDGEARESNLILESREDSDDSRGGQTLSGTDQKFDEDRPGWYIFGKKVKERDCWKCGKKFETRLEMNKFCSPRCKNEYLDTAFTKLRSPLDGGAGDRAN